MNIHVQNCTFEVVCLEETTIWGKGGKTYYSYLATKEEKMNPFDHVIATLFGATNT